MRSSTATRDDPGEPRSTWEMACSKSGHEESKRNWLPKRFRSVEGRLIFNEYFFRLSSGRRVRTHRSTGVSGTPVERALSRKKLGIGRKLGPAGRLGWGGWGGWG